MSSAHILPPKDSHKGRLQTGILLFLALLPGCVLPAILSLTGFPSDNAGVYTALANAALGVCLLLGLRGPWWACAAGGVLTMAGALLSRLPSLFVLPNRLIVYESVCYTLVPFLVLGCARFWKWLTGRQGLSYLLSAVTLLAAKVCLCWGWYLSINQVYYGAYSLPFVLPSPWQLLGSFALFCGVYLLFSLASFRRDPEDEAAKATAPQGFWADSQL